MRNIGTSKRQMRKAAVLAIALGLTGGTLQAEWPQQTQGIPDPFDQDATACRGSRDPACGPNILSSPLRGGVSARRLAHKPSKAAVKAFNQGLRAWNKGESDQALSYFAEAVQLDPAFAEARVNLGALYAKTGRPVEALDQYERALELEPNLALLHSNKAAALVMLSRWEEAEQAGRRAVQLDPQSIDANYMLGIAMMMQGKVTTETAAHLALAAKKYPNARAFLAEVQAQRAAEPDAVF